MKWHHKILRPIPWSPSLYQLLIWRWCSRFAHQKVLLYPHWSFKAWVSPLSHKKTQGWSFQNCSMSTTSFVFFPKETGRVLLPQPSLPAAHHQSVFSHLLLLCSELDRGKLKNQLKYCMHGTTIIKFSHLLCQLWQSTLSSSHSNGAMKDMLQVVLNTPTWWQQPQMEASLSSDEGGISILVSSIILSLMEMKNMPFVPQTKASDKLRLLPQLF